MQNTENNIKLTLHILRGLNGNRNFLKDIDSRIIDNHDWGPKCPSLGSITIPASCANEIIQKLEQSSHVFSINGTDTEAGKRFWDPENNSKNSLLFQYPLTKYAIAGAGIAITAAAIGTGIYLKKNNFF